MASFIYIYSKFTEELLLLSAAGIFSLLAAYSYHWVIKRRRLGAARNQIPSTVVKAYLGQLINEAQFVRTQLFGIANQAGDESHTANFQMPTGLSNLGHHDAPTPSSIVEQAAIPSDLADRLKALQNQLSEKESMVVNINIEKTKLLEEVENLRQNQKAMQTAGAAKGGSDDLVKKIKALEERLEEYSLFEDDLANLKRLQQENANLKKRVEEMMVTPSAAPAPKLEVVQTPAKAGFEVTPSREASSVNQDAIDALLEGIPAVPPTASTEPVEAAPAPVTAAPTALAAAPVAAAPAAITPEAAPAIQAAPAGDEFERLVDSVENSLGSQAATPAAEPPTEPVAMASPASPESMANKSDEELLKEFENLLNS